MAHTNVVFNRHGKTRRTGARLNKPAPVLPTRAQMISPVFGKTFIVPAVQTSFLVNLHRAHRALMQQLADENNLVVEFREDATNSIGQPNPNVYAVHILTLQYDRVLLLSELNTRILTAWAEKQTRPQ